MKRNLSGRTLCLFVIIGHSFLVSSTVAAATTILVTTTADTIADDGQCSLREAIIAANTDSLVKETNRFYGSQTN
jgi:CSLREA domain-containing protein